MWTTQLQSPQTKYIVLLMVHTILDPHPLSPGNKARKNINLSISNYFCQSHLFSADVKSPQARFTDHHKQDFSFLVLTFNYKVTQFSSYINLRLQTSHTPTPNYIFNILRKIWRESFDPCRHIRKSWTCLAPSFPWLTLETKRWNLGLVLYPSLLIKARGLPPSHLTILPHFQPYHLTTLPPFPPTLLPHYPPTISHLRTSPPSHRQIKHFKIATLVLLSLPTWFLT